MLALWYLKMLSAHLLTDFVLQPESWVKGRITHHWKSYHLYLHASVTALVAGIFTGFASLAVPLTILLSHFTIDLWKSYKRQTISYFAVDQILHIAVIVVLGLYLFPEDKVLIASVLAFLNTTPFWLCAMAVIFLSYPAGITIGILTAKWRNQIQPQENSLGSAGKWIGILERLIIFVLVVFDQYAAIGLLTAAKSILRFSDTKDAPQRSEYVLIGTLISVATAITTGLLVKAALK